MIAGFDFHYRIINNNNKSSFVKKVIQGMIALQFVNGIKLAFESCVMLRQINTFFSIMALTCTGRKNEDLYTHPSQAIKFIRGSNDYYRHRHLLFFGLTFSFCNSAIFFLKKPYFLCHFYNIQATF